MPICLKKDKNIEERELELDDSLTGFKHHVFVIVGARLVQVYTRRDTGLIMAALASSEGKGTTGAVDPSWPAFYGDLHRKYIRELGKKTESYEYQVTEHLRLSGVYWGFTAMALLKAETEMEPESVVEWVLQGYRTVVIAGSSQPGTKVMGGGWGGNIGHDVHLLYTTSAVQILAICNALDRLSKEQVTAIVHLISSLQQEDGSFAGDKWLEIDTRFSYCALLTLSILPDIELNDVIDLPAANAFVASCKNFDGGYGCVPGAESHAGQIFCCVAALSIGGALDSIDRDQLGWWLCERQCDSGGLNGRPEKQADVCYSWWVLSAMAILGRLDWIDKEALIGFILRCQNEEDGGIADRPGDEADIFHTFFGFCGLSFLGFFERSGLDHMAVDPTFAMPVDTVERLKLKCQSYFTARTIKSEDA